MVTRQMGASFAKVLEGTPGFFLREKCRDTSRDNSNVFVLNVSHDKPGD